MGEREKEREIEERATRSQRYFQSSPIIRLWSIGEVEGRGRERGKTLSRKVCRRGVKKRTLCWMSPSFSAYKEKDVTEFAVLLASIQHGLSLSLVWLHDARVSKRREGPKSSSQCACVRACGVKEKGQSERTRIRTHTFRRARPLARSIRWAFTEDTKKEEGEEASLLLGARERKRKSTSARSAFLTRHLRL